MKSVAQIENHSRTRMVQMGLRPKPQPHHETHKEKEKNNESSKFRNNASHLFG